MIFKPYGLLERRSNFVICEQNFDKMTIVKFDLKRVGVIRVHAGYLLSGLLFLVLL